MKLVTDATFDTSDPEPNLRYPGNRCCSIWSDDNYSGDSWGHFCISPDGKEEIIDMHDYDFNDTAESWYCGKNVAYDFCNEQIYDSCSYGDGQSGAGTARNPDMGHDGDLTTLKLRYFDSAKRGAVIAFRDNDCTNNSARFYAHENPRMYAEYMKADIEYHNVDNDEIDSVMVPYGYAVDLYSNDNFSGDVLTIKGENFS